MPLESLPDLFNDATHNKLDKTVEKFAKDNDFADITDLDLCFQFVLLSAIIECSKGSLDEKHSRYREGKDLIKTHEELRDMLATAWKCKSYRQIRNLAILRAPRPEPGLPAVDPGVPIYLHMSLSRSFMATYRGAAAEGFYEYLTYNEKLFKTVGNSKYYARFCAIVQSSGTGKSRMLTELRKKEVVVIYMNLRGKQDKLGFPGRDALPSKILTEFPHDGGDYRIVCYAFFTALFDTIYAYLHTTCDTRQCKEAIMKWVGRMCDMSFPPRDNTRAEFFQKVFDRYVKVHTDHVDALEGRPRPTVEGLATSNPITADTDVNKAADKLSRLTTSESSNPPNFTLTLCTAYKKMARSLEKILGNDSDRPKLIIAVDEAHTLASPRSRGGYRPADVFCRVVNDYSHLQNHAVWVVFASTTSKVADLTLPTQKYSSDRIVIQGEKLFPPYTQLGWDQSALELGEIDVEGIAKLGHIARYGRPLWQSLRTTLGFPESVLSTASSKLCAGYTFDPSKTTHVLAVLGQRFSLNVTFGHPDSVEHLETGVASHLRVCLATTLDGNWRFTTYPSEPLLSCVAASDLHAHPARLENALWMLLNTINCGMIDMGQRGELASRLLWLLAKDLFVRKDAKVGMTKMPSSWEDHLIDCEMISVVGWFEFLFGPRIWDEEDSQASLARKTFQDAYLNFSHWICMETNIAGSKDDDALGLNEWTLRHWQRTSGVQCCHQQPLIDKVIPIYFRGGPENASAESRMSHIFISEKTRKSRSSKQELFKITRRHESLSGETGTDSESLPYIAILADLGQPSSFSVTFSERDVDDPCLRIYAAGVDDSTYPFLAKYPRFMKTLEDLVHLQQIPETETPYREYLSAQMNFGTKSTPGHMEWEHGRTVPTV